MPGFFDIPPFIRLWRATHLTKVAGTDITQAVLGHRRRVNTLKYAHLNPDKYSVYMKIKSWIRFYVWNPISILLPIESAKHWKNYPVFNLSKN